MVTSLVLVNDLVKPFSVLKNNRHQECLLLVWGYLIPNTSHLCTQVSASTSKRGTKCASRGTKDNSDENWEEQVGSQMWMGHPDSSNSAQGLRYLGVSRSKAADVVVDLLEDKAPVHEGEASLWTTQAKSRQLRPTVCRTLASGQHSLFLSLCFDVSTHPLLVRALLLPLLWVAT